MSVVKADWVLIPREPTEAMINAYCEAHHELGVYAWTNASFVLPRMIAAAPPAPTLSDEALREGVARIVDPIAFKSRESMAAYCRRAGDDEAAAKRYADETHGAQCDAALAKADAILAFIADHGSSRDLSPAPAVKLEGE
jgi:hypothetical protein